MNVVAFTFDRLAYVDRLKAAGVDEPQARAHAEALDAAFRDTVATKQDIANLERAINDLRVELKRDLGTIDRKGDDLRSEFKHDIAEFRTELKRDMSELRTELKHDMLELRTELKHDMATLGRDLTIRMGGLLVVAVGVLFALLNFSLRSH